MSEKAPKNGEFYNGKLWFERKGSVLTLGLTNSAIEDLGEVESIDFPSEGDDFDKNELILTIEGTHGSLEITSPVAGFIEEVNSSAKDEPEVVSEDPLEEGWLVKLTIQDPTDLRELVESQS